MAKWHGQHAHAHAHSHTRAHSRTITHTHTHNPPRTHLALGPPISPPASPLGLSTADVETDRARSARAWTARGLATVPALWRSLASFSFSLLASRRVAVRRVGLVFFPPWPRFEDDLYMLSPRQIERGRRHTDHTSRGGRKSDPVSGAGKRSGKGKGRRITIVVLHACRTPSGGSEKQRFSRLDHARISKHARDFCVLSHSLLPQEPSLLPAVLPPRAHLSPGHLPDMLGKRPRTAVSGERGRSQRFQGGLRHRD